MSKKFFTNENENTLFNKLKGIFEYQDIHCFDALIGYFRASGYFKIRPFLENVPEIRILVGINVGELTQKYNSKGQHYLEKPSETKNEFLKSIREDIQKSAYAKDVENGIVQFIEDLISGKIKIKASGSQKLHAKIYIFRPKNFNEHTPASVITGSSNLTGAGLGSADVKNYEFNVLLNDYEEVKFATDEFNELWKNAVDILPADIRNVKSKTHLIEKTPFELYIKILIEYFGNAIDYDPTIGKDLPNGYYNLKYQIDAVNDGFQRLMTHRGFILADVVGLGKTIVAALVLKKYIQENGPNTRALIVHPPALSPNWKSTIRDFQLHNYCEFITNGSLHKIIDPDNYSYSNPENFDLIIIDESHKFRSDTSQMYALLQLITKTPRKNVGRDTDRRKKVMLISATPLNNKPEDIANQIYLFQDARSSTIEGIPNLQKFFAKKIRDYKELRKEKDFKKLVEKIKKIYLPIRNKIMTPLVIRRTREDINSIDEYKQDVKKQKLTFPEIKGPLNITYSFDDKLNKLFDKTIDYLIDFDNKGLDYFRYRAIEFLKPEHREKYDDAGRISAQLTEIMRVMLVKRLESSFYAFKQSLKRFHDSNQRMINMFKKDKVFIAPDLNVNKFIEEGKEDELEQKIIELNDESPNNDIYRKDDFEKEFIEGLKKDQAILDEMQNEWAKIDYDPKLKRFFKIAKEKLFDDENIEKKLIIFTESKETVNYLADKMKKNGFDKLLAISAANQNKNFNTIRANFDANYSPRKNDIDIIITTEVLAEGINLHRANVILNYDIPWNATKLMQRIGRINRIGTKADRIYVYNFEPSAEGDAEIDLNQKALKKLQGFHTALGEDNKIYSESEQLEENILGILNTKEETDERIRYLFELRKFREKYPDEFYKIKILPQKCRTGRDSKNVLAWPDDHKKETDSNIVYFKNNRKDTFYLAYGEKAHELTFLEAVKLLEAGRDEKSLPVNKSHFQQVQIALNEFEKTIEWQGDDEVDKEDLGVQERSAINYLNMIKMQSARYDKEFYNLLITAINIIYKGIFKKFRNEIAKEGKAIKEMKSQGDKLQIAIKRLEKIFDKYPVKQIQKLEEKRREEMEKEKIKTSKPKIILSESFK